MSTSRVWKIIAGMVVLFALGGVCGASFVTKGRAHQTSATDRWSERWFALMGEKLELRDDQREQLQPMVEQLQQQLRDLQKETARRAGEIVRQRGRQMWEVLDASQRKRYNALEDDQKLRAASLTAPSH